MNRRRSGRDDTPWPIEQPPVRIVLAQPEGTGQAGPVDAIAPTPPGAPPVDHDGATVAEAEAFRTMQLIAARDRLLEVLVVLDEHCRSPAPGTLDLAIHQINREIGE